jgi:electron transport complex protein RnfG
MGTPANPIDPSWSARHYALFILVLIAAGAIVFGATLLTRERITSNERAWFVARLEALAPPSLHDNDLYADRIVVSAPDLLGSDALVTVFRARRGAQPTAAILTAIAPDGYGGIIELLVGVNYDGTLLGVDVLRHSETPGIGDGFAPHRSNWLKSLVGHSLANTAGVRWAIRKDGGQFDQFTGASITPRAILKAVRRTLEYYAAHRERVFDAPSIHE